MRQVLALALVLSAATIARAENYLHQHVRVERNNGSKVVGEVLAEDDDLIKVKRGTTGWTTIPRDEIEKIVSLEGFWKDVVAKEGAAKTGEDWYQIALLLEKEGFDKGTMEERLKKAITTDPNHEKARKKLGYVKRTNERGEAVWLDAKQAKSFDATSGAIKKDAAAMDERPWSEHRIVVRKPDNKPEYEIITNLPKSEAEDYANFMVELKHALTTLIEKEVYGKSGKKITWIPNPCKICTGKKTGGCPRCGGSGEEPCMVFITNTHKLFNDLTPMPGVGGYYCSAPFPAGDREEKYGYVPCDRPIVAFHGQFGGTGNTYMVLSHEGTHQLEHKMWTGDMRSIQMRPGWLTEGLACYFGDGLIIGAPDKKTGAREMRVDIARDRLAVLKRYLKLPEWSGFKIKDFTSLQPSQFNALHYSYGWSLIYFMLNTKEKFKFGGKEIDLKEAFAKFFAENCEKGAIEEFAMQGKPACLGLARALGLTNMKEAVEGLDALDKMWREYILKLPIAPVGDFDAKDKKKWVSTELKFEISLPGGKKKPKFDWKLVSTEDLNGIFQETMAFTDGLARVSVSVQANSETLDLEDSYDQVCKGLSAAPPRAGRFDSPEPSMLPPVGDKADERPPAIEGSLPGSGVETRVVTFVAHERKIQGYVEKPREKKQKVKMLVCRTAAKIYQIVMTADEDEWSKYEGELNEILGSFAVTGG